MTVAPTRAEQQSILDRIGASNQREKFLGLWLCDLDPYGGDPGSATGSRTPSRCPSR